MNESAHVCGCKSYPCAICAAHGCAWCAAELTRRRVASDTDFSVCDRHGTYLGFVCAHCQLGLDVENAIGPVPHL